MIISLSSQSTRKFYCKLLFCLTVFFVASLLQSQVFKLAAQSQVPQNTNQQIQLQDNGQRAIANSQTEEVKLVVDLPESIFPSPPSFIEEQLWHSRVSQAKLEKDYRLRKEFESRGLNYPPQNIYLRAFKKEGVVELWVQDSFGAYSKFKDYTICATSGNSGPKRMQGDKQVPEGFYYISKFNPQSSYYLSLEINYPNEADKIKGFKSALGGDIYIHGECATAGCLPITNDKIKEVYWLSVAAYENGQFAIPVHIFPFRFQNTQFVEEESKMHPYHVSFWNNIRPVYDHFERSKTLPIINTDFKGDYRMSF